METDNIEPAVLEEIENFAVQIAREAGRILLDHFSGPLEVRYKGKNNRDPVTIADRRSEEYLKAAIKEKFPGHGILGEEGVALAGADSPFLWVLDPLDGTVNYMNGLPVFGVSVGVLWQGRPAAGGIYLPVSHRGTPGVYHARLGSGAFLDDDKLEAAREPTGRPLAQVPPGFRLSGRSRKTPREARNLGSVAAELALTACGVFQYAVFGAPKIWDLVAGLVLITETGGLAFVRPKGGRAWLPLERFQPGPGDATKVLEDLRAWSAPVAVGAPAMVRQVIEDIRAIRHPLSWLTGWRSRDRKSGAGGPGAKPATQQNRPHE